MVLTYAQKLKDPRWQKKRLEVLQRDNWTCTVCGRQDLTLHVHHGYYEYKLDPWDYDTTTLHTVCVDCHDWADDIRRDIELTIARLPVNVQENLVPVIGEMELFFRDLSQAKTDLVIKNFDKFLTWFFTSYLNEMKQ